MRRSPSRRFPWTLQSFRAFFSRRTTTLPGLRVVSASPDPQLPSRRLPEGVCQQSLVRPLLHDQDEESLAHFIDIAMPIQLVSPSCLGQLAFDATMPETRPGRPTVVATFFDIEQS